MCEHCCAYTVDVLAPTATGGATPACFLCAHMLVDHELDVREHGVLGALERRVCRCRKAEIYPPAEIDRREQLYRASAGYAANAQLRAAVKLETFGAAEAAPYRTLTGRGAGVHAVRLETPKPLQADANSLAGIRRRAGRVK